MIKNTNKWVGLSTLGVLFATTFGGLGMTPAHAKHSKKYRNFAIAGGAIAGYGLLKKNKTATIVGGLGGLYAYSKYRKAKKQDRRYGYSKYRRR